MTLWRRTFLDKQMKAWRAVSEIIPFEVWITAEAEKDRAVLKDISPQNQGWEILQLPSLFTLSHERAHDS